MISEPTRGRIMVLKESNKEDIGCIELMGSDLDTPVIALGTLNLIGYHLHEIERLLDEVLHSQKR